MNTMYTPQDRTAAILDRAFELVESVPYTVSARWLFYRLLQEGYYKTKQDYSNKFLKAVSAARHAFYKQWRPDTLADETRESIAGGSGFRSVKSWLQAIAEAECHLNKWHSQPVYLECWYEARAMTDQFRHYTDYVTLRPMGGQPSIPYKWQAAKELERAAREYQKPLVILYFGDLDPAGETISETIQQDVTQWCYEPFQFIRCGLTAEQVARYDVPENIEHPGAYQWEALTDEGAREIITDNLDAFLRHDAGWQSADGRVMDKAISLQSPLLSRLAKASTPEETKEVEQVASAGRAWAKEKDDYEAFVNATYAYILARRKTTELVKPYIRDYLDGRPNKGNTRVTLIDFGFTNMQWNRRVRELEMPLDAFSQIKTREEEAGKWLAEKLSRLSEEWEAA